MEGDFIRINKWLLPLSWLYGLGVRLRNAMFDIGVLKSVAFDVPIISVGNITVGGTGKTPHVEYIAQLLYDKCRVAVLSRGYKRKSSGFKLADEQATAKTIGDEPFQMKQKLPKVTVAVDANRRNGIRRLIEDKPNGGVDVIVLDDAYQHRYVKPGTNILLIDYHRLITHDKLLPAGRLREPSSGKKRADIVIVTKCPADLKPMEYRVIKKSLSLFPYQQLFFTTLFYGSLRPMWRGKERPLDSLKPTEHVLLLTGIASPQQMIHDLSQHARHIHPLAFPDHHNYTTADLERIEREFHALPEPRIIVTTEKDAARLTAAKGMAEDVRHNTFVLPVRVGFMLGQEEKFNESIIDYVRKNSRNGILAKAEDDDKPKDSDNTGNRPRTISFRNYRG